MDEEDEVPLTREALFAGTDDIVLDVVWEKEVRLKTKTGSRLKDIGTSNKASSVQWGREAKNKAHGGPAFECPARPILAEVFERHAGPPPYDSPGDHQSLPRGELLPERSDDSNGTSSESSTIGQNSQRTHSGSCGWRWLSPWQIDNSDDFFTLNRQESSDLHDNSRSGPIEWLYSDRSDNCHLPDSTKSDFFRCNENSPRASAASHRCRRWVRPREKVYFDSSHPRTIAARAAHAASMSESSLLVIQRRNSFSSSESASPSSSDSKEKQQTPQKAHEQVATAAPSNVKRRFSISAALSARKPKASLSPSAPVISTALPEGSIRTTQLTKPAGISPTTPVSSATSELHHHHERLQSLTPEACQNAIKCAQSRGHSTVAGLLRRRLMHMCADQDIFD